jgi:hypothetical protein
MLKPAIMRCFGGVIPTCDACRIYRDIFINYIISADPVLKHCLCGMSCCSCQIHDHADSQMSSLWSSADVSSAGSTCTNSHRWKAVRMQAGRWQCSSWENSNNSEERPVWTLRQKVCHRSLHAKTFAITFFASEIVQVWLLWLCFPHATWSGQTFANSYRSKAIQVWQMWWCIRVEEWSDAAQATRSFHLGAICVSFMWESVCQ